MNYNRKLVLVVSLMFCLSAEIFSQCNISQTITVCNMQNIDFDMDGKSDGIINLYTETGTVPSDGRWVTDPRFAVVLDPITGNVRTWEFFNATEDNKITDYRFRLFNDTCGSDPQQIVDLILGPFSGVTLPSRPNDANIEICDSSTLDLNESLISDVTIPSAHLNGEWVYVGSSSGDGFKGAKNLRGSIFSAMIPYDSGPPTVDREIFEFKYIVGGISPCDPFMETTVKVSVVRQVNPGKPQEINICESDILAGNWDASINLRGEEYLVGEDIEGVWVVDNDPTGQISDEQDSIINIREIYDELVDTGKNLRFGCQVYNFTYLTPQRSSVCIEQKALIPFKIFEELRPFQQTDGIPEFCLNQTPATIDLFDLLEFTTVDETDFIYKDDKYVSWKQLSGVSDLNIKSQPDSLGLFLKNSNFHLGTINISNATPGTYTFQFGVSPDINCKVPNKFIDPFVTDVTDLTYSRNPCDILSTIVTIEILPLNYGGEDTSGLLFCETKESVDLRSLLKTNGTDTLVETGVWTDADNTIINNVFVFPEISTQQVFSFTYTTTTDKSCTKSATLSFTVYKEANAGEGQSIALCTDNLTITLFDLLTDTPDETGIWTGPFGYISTNHLGTFNKSDIELPVLGAGEYVYTVLGNAGCPSSDEAAITIKISEPVSIGNDVNETYCILDGSVNLFSLLDRQTVRTGVFEDTENTTALTDKGIVEFNQLPNPENLVNPIYTFRYVVPNEAPCDQSSLIVAIQIIDLPEPEVSDQEFCILDTKHLDDIEVDVLNYNWYSSLESQSPILDNPLLFDADIYYIAAVDVDNCESDRVTVKMNILNTGERSATGALCTIEFQDGVSPDGNNQNDTFVTRIDNVYNIPEAFPDFEIKIFNRYGTEVYAGNRDTEDFRGESNTSIRLGDDLPSGTYFYIFSPNFDNNLPIQGSFYLAR